MGPNLFPIELYLFYITVIEYLRTKTAHERGVPVCLMVLEVSGYGVNWIHCFLACGRQQHG